MTAQFSRESLINDLKLHTCEIRFTKVNGEKRIMHCTLLPEHLPASTDRTALEEAHTRPENQDVIAVWDLQASAWRSFRVDSVEYAQAIDGY
jgi:hypothetical protein